MLNECKACGYLAKIRNGLCDRCEFAYYSGVEERSFITAAMIARIMPKDMSDPWDMVGA